MKKALSILNYIVVMLIPALALVTAPFTYPLVYLFRNIDWVRNSKPFWYWFDDEDGLYGAEYWKDAKGITKDNFWTSFRWSALCNPMWNLHASITPKEGKEVYISERGGLTRDDEPMVLSNVATMFFVDEDGNWSNNTGEFLALEYSIIGWVWLWFKIEDRLYWRFSLVKNLFGKIWIEIQLGVGYRYTFRLKIKNVEIY